MREMKPNEVLGKLSLYYVVGFFIVMGLQFAGLPLFYLSFLFGYLMYAVLAISFFVTAFYWYKDRSKENLRYVIYSIIAGGSILVFLIIMFYMLSQTLQYF